MVEAELFTYMRAVAAALSEKRSGSTYKAKRDYSLGVYYVQAEFKAYGLRHSARSAPFSATEVAKLKEQGVDEGCRAVARRIAERNPGFPVTLEEMLGLKLTLGEGW